MDRTLLKCIIKDYNPHEDYAIIELKNGTVYNISLGEANRDYNYIYVSDMADTDVVILANETERRYIPCSEVESIAIGGLHD